MLKVHGHTWRILWGSGKRAIIMRSKTDLFELIRAMSSSEKRYFKIAAQKTGNKGAKYLDLFNFINGMDKYEEAKLKKKFPKNLSTDKAYLYEAIMRSMRDYHSAKSKSTRLKELLIDAKYMQDRGLYSQAEERLREAKELATDIDDQLALLEINRESRDIAWITSTNLEEKMSLLFYEMMEVLENVNDYYKYSDLGARLMIATKKNYALSHAETIKDTVAKIEPSLNSSSPLTQRKYLLTRGLKNRLKGSISEAIHFMEQVISLWETHPQMRNEATFKFVSDLSNLISTKLSVTDVKSLVTDIEQLENVETTNHHLQSIVFQKAQTFKIIYLINTGDQHPIDDIESDIAQGLQKFQISTSGRHALIANLATLLFVNAKFKKCFDWCKKIISDGQSGSRKDLQIVAYLLKLFSSYEFMEVEALEKEWRSTQRYLNQNSQVKNVEALHTTLDLFKNIIHAPLLELTETYKQLKGFIKVQHKDQTNYLPMGIDEVILWWVESKICRTSILNILRKSKEETLYQVKPAN